MSELPKEDILWLTSAEATPYLDRARNHGNSLTSLAKSLRKELSPQRSHLILEQAELRDRAREKFKHADRMFFTRPTLQQSTSEDISRYVASRFPRGESVADLCCGIGGNLLALAERGPVTGVEQDPTVAHFAQCNARAIGDSATEIVVGDAATYPLDCHTAFFIDPDRRAHGRRTVDLRYYQPNLDSLDRLLSACPNAAIKLAPATAVPGHWRTCAELEWIGYARECKQQVAWFGQLANHAGLRVATVCSRGDSKVRTVVENPNSQPDSTGEFGRFIYIPHAAVLAARLVFTIALEHSLAPIANTADLLTGKHLVLDKAMTSFEAVAECSFDPKTVSSLLIEHDIVPNVVRTIGHRGATAKLAEKLPRDGSKAGGLFVCKRGSNRRVIIAVRR